MSLLPSFPKTDRDWHEALASFLLISGVCAFIQLLWFPAPYGRYSQSKGWGRMVPARAGWLIMETPNLWVSLLIWLWGATDDCKHSLANLAILGCFILHYINRSLIYPLQMSRNPRPMPVSVMLMAFSFCTLNGYLQARYLLSYKVYPQEWLSSPPFIIGLVVFLLGFCLNIQADHILRNLRKPGESGYKVPHGGLFEYVSSANYAAEMIEWIGFASMSGFSSSSVTFAVFTFLNLAPRAYYHHLFYKEKFREDYPSNRKAIIPFLF